MTPPTCSSAEVSSSFISEETPGAGSAEIPSVSTTSASSRERAEANRHFNTGILYGCLAYIVWGLIPLYFKLLTDIPTLDILANRIGYSLPLLFLLVWWLGKGQSLLANLKKPRIVGNLALCALLLSTNWYLFLYATFSDQIMQSSLAYFMLPLFNVLFGVIFLKEKLVPFQVFCVGLATFGVSVMTVGAGVFPWLAISLATTFAAYGLVHKITPVDSVLALTIEMMSTFPIAIAFLFWQSPTVTPEFWQNHLSTGLLLILGGFLTAAPLLMFIIATKRVRLITLGMLQYIAPTIQFFLAWQLYGEALTWDKLFAFGCIWMSLVIFMVGSSMAASRASKSANSLRV